VALFFLESLLSDASLIFFLFNVCLDCDKGMQPQNLFPKQIQSNQSKSLTVRAKYYCTDCEYTNHSSRIQINRKLQSTWKICPVIFILLRQLWSFSHRQRSSPSDRLKRRDSSIQSFYFLSLMKRSIWFLSD